jgi:hypothetical protein
VHERSVLAEESRRGQGYDADGTGDKAWSPGRPAVFERGDDTHWTPLMLIPAHGVLLVEVLHEP